MDAVTLGGTMLYPDGSSASYPDNPVEEKKDSPVTAGLFKLNSVYPNPFNQTVNISFSLPAPGDIQIEALNIHGQIIQKELLSYTTSHCCPVGYHVFV